MAGITTAQYLRKKIGVVVSHEVKGGDVYACVVRQNGKIISSRPDDPTASLSYLTLENIFIAAKQNFQVLRNYARTPASAFIGGKFNPINIVGTFDRSWYEEKVVPFIEGKTNFDQIKKIYADLVWDDNDAIHHYENYDWMVQLYVELRKCHHLIPSELQAVPEGDLLEPIEALKDMKKAKYVNVTENDPLFPALQAVCPEGEFHDGIFYCHPSEARSNILGVTSFQMPEIQWGELPLAGEVVEMGDLSNLLDKVYFCSRSPKQKLSTDLQEFLLHGGHPDLLDVSKGGLGKHKVAGFGKYSGLGKLSDCIDRLADYLEPSLPHVDRSVLREFAAGRIANLQSSKIVEKIGGEYFLKPRSE